MDDVQENLGALVARYVLGTCQVLVLDLNLGYTCAGNVGHFPGTAVSGAMRCCRRSVAFSQSCVLNPQLASQLFQTEMGSSYSPLMDPGSFPCQTQKRGTALVGLAEAPLPVVALAEELCHASGAPPAPSHLHSVVPPHYSKPYRAALLFLQSGEHGKICTYLLGST